MATDATDQEAPAAYRELVEHVERRSNVEYAGSVLNWDQQVTMPEGGTPARSQQLSALSAVSHDLLTDDRVGEWLDSLDEADLTGRQAALVREVRREYERAVRVPTDLVERISRAASEALPEWEEAKAEDDFEGFAPRLEQLVELKREYAEHVDPDRDPYAVLFEEYEPYLDVETAEAILTDLREGLVDLIDGIRDSDADLAADPFGGSLAVETQEELVRETLDTLDYDWDHGRLDTAPHPFSTGTPYDARVTTRYDENDPLGALTSTIHEFGHATYTLGLPKEDYGTPLGEARDLTVHESQSRFWENHVGRSRAFWEGFAPTAAEATGRDVDPDRVYEAANRVDPDNLIRVEADELTYHLHIVLRFEIERDLVRGDLDVDEIPAVWNDRMDEYLGVRPETDSRGCLQDIHWTHGSFGYFPTYSLGSVLAAAIDATVREEIDVDARVRDGEFDPIMGWLRENVHRHGKRYTTPELIERATGEPLSADPFLEYAERKFGDLYGL